MRILLRTICTVGLFGSWPALAQDEEKNPVTQADDAFGQSVGNERIGLYSFEDVRGFSPVDAGNTRIEGLYFAPVIAPNGRVARGNTVRVGISAQGYPFPAPTGIVDYQLNLPDGTNSLSASFERAQFGGPGVFLEGHARLTDQLGAFAGGHLRRQERHEGTDFDSYHGEVSLTWRPYNGARVATFFNYYRAFRDEATPAIFPAGDYLPPRIERRDNIGQSWADRDNRQTLGGVLGTFPFGDWNVDAGIFHAGRETPETYSDLFTRLRPDGSTPNRIIVLDRENSDRMLSGEVRATRQWTMGSLAHRATLSLRAKEGHRAFGGAVRVSLGESTLLSPGSRAEPAVAPGPNDRDFVGQKTIGVAYTIARPGYFSLDLSASRASYRKAVEFASPITADFVARAKPWTGSVTGSLELLPRLAVYGGYVRGFEEAAIAPEVATNRGVAPPAIRTRQVEVGLRYALAPNLNLVAGVFAISKPYFALDPLLEFRELGRTTSKGLELSLAGPVLPGLNVVAGTVLLDPQITGPEVDGVLIGKRPVGSLRRRSIFNLDWRTEGGQGAWSFDASAESLSSRVANTSNKLHAPPRTTLAMGMRYRFAMDDMKALLRVQMINVTDIYSWLVAPSGAFGYERGRNLLVELHTDF